MTTEQPRYLSIAEVAVQLSVSEKTIRGLVDSGELPASRVGRQWRISQTAVDDYMSANLNDTPSPEETQ